jgi:hypothetical protein
MLRRIHAARLIRASAALLLLPAAVCTAEPPAQTANIDPVRPFSDLDLDHDGVLTPSEAHASPRLGDAWVDIDTNNDGVIDGSELRALSETTVAPTAAETER